MLDGASKLNESYSGIGVGGWIQHPGSSIQHPEKLIRCTIQVRLALA